jgi:uncharacterized protein (TIGR03067 family)
MKTASACFRSFLVLAAALPLCLPFGAAGAEPGFTSLFNGHDLTGWDGSPDFWSVQDGAITARTVAGHLPKENTFLIWKGGDVSDFEFRCQFRIEPGDSSGFANSGVQYRSHIVDASYWVVGGYQADMEAGPTYTGNLYEERGRGTLASRGQMVDIEPDGSIRVLGTMGSSEEILALIKKGDWNDYDIIARGNHLTQIINGRVTVDVTDDQVSKRAMSGVLALQLHTGHPMMVQFKNIRLRNLTQASARSDLDAVQGHWVPEEVISNGQTASADDLAQVKLAIKGKSYSVETANGEDEGTFELVESSHPKQMNVVTRNGDQIAAIYAVRDGRLRVCYAVNGADRPTEFKSTEGSDHVLAVYKRAQP